jgi:hypothetical protein
MCFVLESISAAITSIIGIGIEFFVYLNEKLEFFFFPSNNIEEQEQKITYLNI